MAPKTKDCGTTSIVEAILIKVIDSMSEEEDIQSDPTADFGLNEEEAPYQAHLDSIDGSSLRSLLSITRRNGQSRQEARVRSTRASSSTPFSQSRLIRFCRLLF